MPTVVNAPNFELAPALKANDEEPDSDGVAFPVLLGIESSDEDEGDDKDDPSPSIARKKVSPQTTLATKKGAASAVAAVSAPIQSTKKRATTSKVKINLFAICTGICWGSQDLGQMVQER